MYLEKLATILSSLTAILLLIIKMFTWIITNSVSILYSAIDSLLDFFISFFNYFAVKNAVKKPDKRFNYGRWKIEALASFLEWLIILLSWIYIFYESIIKFVTWEKIVFLEPAIIVMWVSIIITWTLVLFLNYVAKKTKSLVIETDSLHYKTDLYTNSWILISLVVIYYTDFHYIDSILWIILSIYIIFSAIKIIKKWFLLILDVSLKKEHVKKIIEIIENTDQIKSYHFLKTRKSWKLNFVQAHLVFSNPHIKLIEAHSISDQIEHQIEQIDNSRKWIIDFHLDPYDDEREDYDEEKCAVDFS